VRGGGHVFVSLGSALAWSLPAYGAGLQERFLHAQLATTGAAVGIGIGGTLDFIAATARRAPRPRTARAALAAGNAKP